MNHSFNTDVAKLAGVHTSIFVTDLAFWTLKNINHQRNFKDGKYWSYETLKGLVNQYYYLSKKKVETLIAKAVKLGLIEKGNFNKSGYDRTCWYSLTEFAWSFFPELSIALSRISTESDLSAISPKGEMEISKTGNGNLQNGTAIPDTLPDTLTNTTTTRSLQESKSEISAEQLSSSGEKPSEEEREPVFDKDTDAFILTTSGQHSAKDDREYLLWCKYWCQHKCRAQDTEGQLRVLTSIIKCKPITKPDGFTDDLSMGVSKGIADDKYLFSGYLMTVMGDVKRGFLAQDFIPKSFTDWLEAGKPAKEKIFVV